MAAQIVFHLDETLRTNFKLATVVQGTTIKQVLTDAVKKYVNKTEDIMWTKKRGE